jgi:hypothetical protein
MAPDNPTGSTPPETEDRPAGAAELMAELREQVRERRARLSPSGDDPHAFNLAELRRAADAVNDTWFVSAHLPITWDKRVIGRVGAYTKRLVRLLLRWYINPIVEQQNRFNSAVARAVTEMNAYQERMTREWQILDERIARLEEARGQDRE